MNMIEHDCIFALTDLDLIHYVLLTVSCNRTKNRYPDHYFIQKCQVF